ncbi:MAG: hypothetical protein ACYCTV_10485 [Leptospirales bacterium]
MKLAYIALVIYVATVMVSPSASAQQSQIVVNLVQTAKPILPSYPGVSADILGIRIGMTLSQAEAIAAKNYPGKPAVTKSTLTTSYRGITAQSKPYVSSVEFGAEPNTHNWLTLYFSSLATGNVVIGMYREIDFNNPLKAPLLSAVKASIIKKYGPYSARTGNTAFEYFWQFGKQARIPCNPSGCYAYSLRDGETDAIPVALSNGVDMGIVAYPVPSNSDASKIGSLEITIVDYQDWVNSADVATKQLNNAAIEHYNKVNQSTGVPKL